MSTFVLVHGAWHGAWCWYKIATRLEARGHTVIVPDMPGHGADRTPIESVTLDDIVARIGAAVEAAPEPVILVGHSYGGAVISQTAERHAPKVARLVYVAAFLLENGRTVLEAAAGDDSDLAPAIVPAPDGRTATVDPASLKVALYGCCSAQDIALARASLGPEAFAGFRTPLQLTKQNFGRIPRHYVECSEDRATSIGLQRRMQAALPCERVFTLQTDHSPFFSAPDALTDCLAGA